jgi:16S rRNA (cytidine1402-2'-O)-methyltransferase
MVDGAVRGTASGSEKTDVEHVLQVLLAELPLKQAVALTAAITGGSRNQLYARALAAKAGGD